MSEGGANSESDPVAFPLPITDVLDLHTFQPREVKDLLTEYLAECQRRNILKARIIHGKGMGQLRRGVRSILSRHPQVVSFSDDHSQFGGWGATLVQLRAGNPTGAS